MKKRIMGIYSDEVGYANQLMDYLNSRNDIKMEVRIFTTKDSLLNCRTESEIGVLLLEERLKEVELDLEGIPTVVCLTEDWQGNNDEINSIFKFQKLDHIVKELFQIMIRENDMGTVPYGSGGGELIGIYTPYGDINEISLAIMEKLSQTYATLYINMEWYPNVEVEKKGLTDLLYFVHERKKNFPLYLSTLIEKRQSVDILSPVSHFKDLLDLEGEDVHRFLKELKGNGNYEKIVIQMDFLGEHTFDMLNGCNRIILPLWKNKTGKEKLETLKRYLKLEGKEDLLDRIHIVELPIQMGDKGFLNKLLNLF